MTKKGGLTFYLVKVVAIIYLTAAYTLLSFIASAVTDVFLYPTTVSEEHTIFLLIKMTIHVCLLTALFYGIRNVIHALWVPFNGVAGFDSSRVKELDGGVAAGFALFLLCPNLSSTATVIKRRFTNFRRNNNG